MFKDLFISDLFMAGAALILIWATFITVYFFQYRKEIRRLKEYSRHMETKYSNEIGYRKSSEVRLGKIAENLAPFTDGWPYDPNNFIFLGREVDGIQLNDDEIVFIEIKTGKSRLSKSQKRIQQIIKEGKVHFETYRIDETGCTLTRS